MARYRAMWIAVAAVIVLCVVVLVVSRDEGTSGPEGPPGTKRFKGLERTHVGHRVSYEETPPVGGDHSAIWQDCGFYGAPIRPELGVHSMEHGAVWITYRWDLDAGEVDQLRALTEGRAYVLVSPWESGLPSAVVATAWGRQLRLASASDPRLREFVRAFEGGRQAPERGGPCSGGVGRGG